MEKKNILIIFAFTIILFGIMHVSAFCCEKVKDADQWCIDKNSESQCDSTYSTLPNKAISPKFCDEIPECGGTCYSPETGECTENSPKAQCILSKGKWDVKPAEELQQCQEGCCVIGKDAWFMNEVECKKKAKDSGVEWGVQAQIKWITRAECEDYQLNVKKGACIISAFGEKTCIIDTDTHCKPQNLNELKDKLKNSASIEDINVEFKEGLLCTAIINGVSISDCTKTSNTICEENKIYYLDSCNNLANVYDSKKYDNPDYPDYWNKLLNPYTSNEVCTVPASGSNICGNCDTTSNTVCRDSGEAEEGIPKQGKLVCGDMSCKDKNNVIHQHGDSWCAGTAGTLLINKNVTTGEIFLSNITTLKNPKNYNTYNIPGSRYYKLVCSFGDILVEECGDYRNSVCIQGKNDDSKKTEASCVFNPWRSCLEVDGKTDCEAAGSLCKWIPGYRWDFSMVAEKDRKEYQGTCVPLIAPGYDFWNGNSDGNMFCAMAGIQENVLFENHWMGNRNNMADWSKKDLANKCLDKCYALPKYGIEFKFNGIKVYPEDVKCESGEWIDKAGGCPNNYSVLTDFYAESEFELDAGVSTYHLSDRRGQYCNKIGEPDQWLTGGVTGDEYNCAGIDWSSRDERKERDYPIYLTNEEWIMAITERTHYLGDCGYKKGVSGQSSDPSTELITVIFQKLKQKGDVKENITVEQIIYKGNAYVNREIYETELPVSTNSEKNSQSCADKGGACVVVANNPYVCTEEERIADGTCSQGRVCCTIS